MNISHTVYPDRKYTFNELIANIYNREKINIDKEKDINVNKSLGYFKIASFKQTSLREYIKQVFNN